MKPGALDAKTKELICLAASVANDWHDRTAAHTHFAKTEGPPSQRTCPPCVVPGRGERSCPEPGSAACVSSRGAAIR